MPSSQTSICNAALMKIGDEIAISAISDKNKPARLLRRCWDSCLDQTLAMEAWPFATTYQALPLLLQSPMPGWQYRYAYPSTCLNALAVCTEDGIRNVMSTIQRGEWATRSQSMGLQSYIKCYGDQSTSICTDLEDAYLIYVTRVTDVTRFTPLFEEALACRLAAEIAPGLAGEMGYKLRNVLRDDLQNTMSVAVHNEYNESRDPVHSSNAILASRNT